MGQGVRIMVLFLMNEEEGRTREEADEDKEEIKKRIGGELKKKDGEEDKEKK